MKLFNVNVLVLVVLLSIQCEAHVKQVIEEADRRVKGLANILTTTLFGGIKVGVTGHVSTSGEGSETVNEPPPRRPGLFGSIFNRPTPVPHHQHEEAGSGPPGGRPDFGNPHQGGYNHGGHFQGGYHQGGYNQGEYNYGGYNQGGYNQGGYNQGGHHQGGYHQGGYMGESTQDGFNQGGYNQGGPNNGEVPTVSTPKENQWNSNGPPQDNYGSNNNQQGNSFGENQQGNQFGNQKPDSNEIKRTSQQPAVDLPQKTTPPPKQEEDKPIFVALNPGEYEYGGEGIKIQKPTTEPSDEFEIDVRGKFDEEETKETKGM